MLFAPTGPLPLAGHWRGPDNTEQLGRSSAVATMHNLSFIPYFFLYGWSRRPPLRYAICHWHVFQMCFSLARRVEITGGQGKQTVVLLYRLHRGFVESEWTQAKVSQSTDTYLNMWLHKKTAIPREKQRVLQSLDSSQPVLEMLSH